MTRDRFTDKLLVTLWELGIISDMVLEKTTGTVIFRVPRLKSKFFVNVASGQVHDNRKIKY